MKQDVKVSLNYTKACIVEDALKVQQSALRDELAATLDPELRAKILYKLSELRKLLTSAQAARRVLADGHAKVVRARAEGEQLLNELGL